MIPDDVKQLAPALLRHRLILSPAAEIEGLGEEVRRRVPSRPIEMIVTWGPGGGAASTFRVEPPSLVPRPPASGLAAPAPARNRPG